MLCICNDRGLESSLENGERAVLSQISEMTWRTTCALVWNDTRTITKRKEIAPPGLAQQGHTHIRDCTLSHYPYEDSSRKRSSIFEAAESVSSSHNENDNHGLPLEETREGLRADFGTLDEVLVRSVTVVMVLITSRTEGLSEVDSNLENGCLERERVLGLGRPRVFWAGVSGSAVNRALLV